MKVLYNIGRGMLSWALWVALGSLAVSCAEKEPSLEIRDGEPLCLTVKNIEELSGDTRSMLVGPDRLRQLENSCTGNFNKRGKKTVEPSNAPQCIRLNGSFQPHGETKLTPVFHMNELIFDTVDNTFFTQWNYAGVEKDWVKGATYQFRAFYPGKSEMKGSSPGVQQIAGDDATQIVLKYWTQNIQEDLLVASAAGGSPVQLDFRHALAAVRFRFKFADDVEDDDRLTSCRLENEADDAELIKRIGCFGNIGSMIYGNGDILANPVNREYMEWKVNWCDRISYSWKHKNGIPFSHGTSGSVEATAYTGTDAELEEGAVFVQNDGWIYVIPQTVTKGLRLCFTTRDNTVGEFKVPLMGQMGAGPDDPIVYEAGNRYTYTLVFTQTKMDLVLDIEPWIEVDLPEDIEL